VIGRLKPPIKTPVLTAKSIASSEFEISDYRFPAL
jgi:hypothetical protein